MRCGFAAAAAFVLALSVFRFGAFFAGTPVAEKATGRGSQQPAQEKTPCRKREIGRDAPPSKPTCIDIKSPQPPRPTDEDVGPIRATCPFWPPDPSMKYATNGELNSQA
jgi:hypothetical protein